MTESNRFSKQIRNMIGNEACQRFSFYGLVRAIVKYVNQFKGIGQFYFFAVTMFVISSSFMFLASRYRYTNQVATA